MVHDTVAEIGGEDLAGLGTVGDETDRAPRLIGVCPQLLLQGEQVGFGGDAQLLAVRRRGFK